MNISSNRNRNVAIVVLAVMWALMATVKAYAQSESYTAYVRGDQYNPVIAIAVDEGKVHGGKFDYDGWFAFPVTLGSVYHVKTIDTTVCYLPTANSIVHDGKDLVLAETDQIECTPIQDRSVVLYARGVPGQTIEIYAMDNSSMIQRTFDVDGWAEFIVNAGDSYRVVIGQSVTCYNVSRYTESLYTALRFQEAIPCYTGNKIFLPTIHNGQSSFIDDSGMIHSIGLTACIQFAPCDGGNMIIDSYTFMNSDTEYEGDFHVEYYAHDGDRRFTGHYSYNYNGDGHHDQWIMEVE